VGNPISDQFDDEPGGGFADWVVGGTADATFEDPDEGLSFWVPGYDSQRDTDGDGAHDSIDLPGGSASEEAGNALDKATGGLAQYILPAALLGVGLYLLRPVLQIIANLTDS